MHSILGPGAPAAPARAFDTPYSILPRRQGGDSEKAVRGLLQAGTCSNHGRREARSTFVAEANAWGCNHADQLLDLDLERRQIAAWIQWQFSFLEDVQPEEARLDLRPSAAKAQEEFIYLETLATGSLSLPV